MTGALLAHAFASARVPAVVLEAETVGSGSTAASAALLLQEPDMALRQLARRYGSRAGRRIWELSRESVQELVSLVRASGISCDMTRRDTIYYAADAASTVTLRRECDARARAGFAAEWLSPGALRRRTGLAGGGAILTRGGAQFDPYAAGTGIMAAAARAGARVFERSRVTSITPGRHAVRIKTQGGVVNAERVIIATGYATPWLRPLAGRFQMYRTYVLTTEPIGRADRDDLGMGDVLLWNTERPYHYARWTADHRLMLGGGDVAVAPRQRRAALFAQATRELRAYFESRLPALASIATASTWEGLFALTPDSLPYIGPHRHYPRHWFALGYGGNGMTFSALAARLLVERWHGDVSPDHALFEFGRMRT